MIIELPLAPSYREPCLKHCYIWGERGACLHGNLVEDKINTYFLHAYGAGVVESWLVRWPAGLLILQRLAKHCYHTRRCSERAYPPQSPYGTELVRWLSRRASEFQSTVFGCFEERFIVSIETGGFRDVIQTCSDDGFPPLLRPGS